MTRRRVRFAALAALGVGACMAPPPEGPMRDVPAFRAEGLHRLEIRRVVLMPFDDDADARKRARSLEDALARQLEMATGMEVVRLGEESRWELAPTESPRRRGTYDVGTVVEVASRYGADAVLYGAITAYRPYVPQALGLRGELVLAKTGLVVWSFDASFDLADAASSRALADVHRRLFARRGEELAWSTIEVSPEALAALVCARAVEEFFPAPPPIAAR